MSIRFELQSYIFFLNDNSFISYFFTFLEESSNETIKPLITTISVHIRSAIYTYAITIFSSNRTELRPH